MNKRIGILWISVLLLVSGCTSRTGTPSPAITTKATQLPTTNILLSATLFPPKTAPPTQTPAPTNTVTPTSTHWPTITARPTYTPRPTKTPTPTTTTTWTPIPTLSPDKAQAKVLELLKTNGGCKLPCWWGVTPGVSTDADFEALFTPYSAISPFYKGESYKSVEFEFGQEIITFLNIYYRTRPDQNTIDIIDVSTWALRKIGDKTYQEAYTSGYYHLLLKYYSLPQILTVYGVPSKISMTVRFDLYDGRPPSPSQRFGTLNLHLFYPEKGIFVIYEMALSNEGEYGKACPSESYVSLTLSPPDIDGHYEKLFSSRLSEGEDFDYDKPTEEAINMSLEEFYETFRTLNQECVQTPLSIWPSPYSR